MPGQCATTTLTRTTTVAAGIHTPGHLGELTQYIPCELVEAVLAETGRLQRRLRPLPSRVGVYFVLAMALFPELGYAGVWRQLTAPLGALAPQVCETALRHLRRRITAAPLKALFETLAVPLAPPCATGADAPSPSTAARPSRHRTATARGAGSERSATGWPGPAIRP